MTYALNVEDSTHEGAQNDASYPNHFQSQSTSHVSKNTYIVYISVLLLSQMQTLHARSICLHWGCLGSMYAHILVPLVVPGKYITFSMTVPHLSCLQVFPELSRQEPASLCPPPPTAAAGVGLGQPVRSPAGRRRSEEPIPRRCGRWPLEDADAGRSRWGRAVGHGASVHVVHSQDKWIT